MYLLLYIQIQIEMMRNAKFEISSLRLKLVHSAAKVQLVQMTLHRLIIKIFGRLILVRVIERPLLSTGSISNCKYHGNPGKVE